MLICTGVVSDRMQATSFICLLKVDILTNNGVITHYKILSNRLLLWDLVTKEVRPSETTPKGGLKTPNILKNTWDLNLDWSGQYPRDNNIIEYQRKPFLRQGKKLLGFQLEDNGHFSQL